MKKQAPTVTSLTICICTLHRPESLARALASVRRGNAQPLEVVVSDDGDDLETKFVAERYGARYVVGPGRGLGANRNRAAGVATGSHIAFIDDDVEISEDFVARGTTLIARWPEDILTGWELNHSVDPALKVVPNNPNFLGFQRVHPGQDLRGIVINATVFPRRLFDVARFDEQVTYGYEELDMARQAVARGWRLRFDELLWVSHFPSPINRDKYARVLTASRLYLTWRAYSCYDGRPFKAAAFLAAGTMHHVAVSLSRGLGWNRTIEPLTLAYGYARRSRRPPTAD